MEGFRLDQKLSEEEIKTLAEIASQLPPECVQNIRDAFDGWHSREFYEGLLSGYERMRVLLNNVSVAKIDNFSEQLVLFLAGYLHNLPKKDN